MDSVKTKKANYILQKTIRLQMEAWTLLYKTIRMETEAWTQSDEGRRLYALLHEARIRRELIL